MSLLSDIAIAIKTKLGGTSINNTIPRYDGTTCTLKKSDVTISDTNVVTAGGGFVGNLTGTASNATLAASATKLATARTINGVAFDGTANITIADSTKAPLSHNHDASHINAGTLSVDRLPTIPNTKISGLGTASAINVGDYVGQISDNNFSSMKGALASNYSNSLGYWIIKLPVLANSNIMCSFEIKEYGNFQSAETYTINGYLYNSSNNWHNSRVTTTGSTDITLGRDNSGYAYVCVPARSYSGVSILSGVQGFNAYPLNLKQATITFSASKETLNTVTPTFRYMHHSDNILTSTGQSTVFPMTQKAVTDAIQGVSDARDKTNIQNTDIGLELIEKLNVVTYNLNKRDWYRTEEATITEETELEDGTKNTTTRVDDKILKTDLKKYDENDGHLAKNSVYTGLIAQDVKEAYESLGLDLSIVKNMKDEYEGGDDRYYIEYNGIIPLLINAIKELNNKVKSLEDKLKTEGSN